MSKKFTQEEYRKIVELHDKRYFSVNGVLDVIIHFVHTISRTGDADIDTALAIANPLTREWAHDKFVEKEKKYYWKHKDNWAFGLASDGIIINISSNKKSKLTESEIKEWGYNPEMFDREEVQ